MRWQISLSCYKRSELDGLILFSRKEANKLMLGSAAMERFPS